MATVVQLRGIPLNCMWQTLLEPPSTYILAGWIAQFSWLSIGPKSHTHYWCGFDSHGVVNFVCQSTSTAESLARKTTYLLLHCKLQCLYNLYVQSHASTPVHTLQIPNIPPVVIMHMAHIYRYIYIYAINQSHLRYFIYLPLGLYCWLSSQPL